MANIKPVSGVLRRTQQRVVDPVGPGIGRRPGDSGRTGEAGRTQFVPASSSNAFLGTKARQSTGLGAARPRQPIGSSSQVQPIDSSAIDSMFAQVRGHLAYPDHPEARGILTDAFAFVRSAGR